MISAPMTMTAFSPRERGWSGRGAGHGPAHRDPFSPRERGWSELIAAYGIAQAVLPARAGVVRRARPGRGGVTGFPRASRVVRRGWRDIGYAFGSPRASGGGSAERMEELLAAGFSPRERDGPSKSVVMRLHKFSPRERGWSVATLNRAPHP